MPAQLAAEAKGQSHAAGCKLGKALAELQCAQGAEAASCAHQQHVLAGVEDGLAEQLDGGDHVHGNLRGEGCRGAGPDSVCMSGTPCRAGSKEWQPLC